MAARLCVESLRQALQEAIGAPTARRTVVVSGVHLAHSAAFLAFLRFQAGPDRGLWRLQNAGRLAELASLDALFQAIAIDILPALIADPTSAPILAALSRYARYIKCSASAVGGDFSQVATRICDAFIAHADTASRWSAPELLRRSKELLHRLHTVRSQRVTISSSDPVFDPVSDSDSDPNTDENVVIGLQVTSLRMALQEVIDAPAAELCVTVDAVRASHSSALLGVVRFQATACSWNVRNLDRIKDIADIDACFQVIGLGFLRVLNNDPICRPVLVLLFDFVSRLRKSVGAVGGDFVEDATAMCDRLIAHAITGSHRALLVPAPEMKMRTEKLRRDLAMLRCRNLSIDSGSDTDSSSTSGMSITSSSASD